MLRRRAVAAGLLTAPFATPAGAAAPGGPAVLRIGIALAPNAADPHFFNGYAEKALALHVFSRLVEQTGDTRLQPGLALSWRPLGDTLWEFKLRPGVRFSDGTALGPDDVVFSYQRAPAVPNTPGGFGPVLRKVAAVVAVDADTLHVTTTEPHPNLPNDLANVAIVSRRIGTGATTADYNTLKAAIGSGPYRLVAYGTGTGYTLERNPHWWGERPDWDRVEVHVIAAPGSRTAALLAGDVDLVDAPSVADLPRLRADPRLTVVSTPGTRLWFLRLDRSRAGGSPFIAGPDGAPLPANPLNDRRVREALSLSINRAALAERVMAGTAAPTGQWLPPGSFSYNPAIPVPAFEPDRTRALLAEAGFSAGLQLTLHGAAQPEALQAVAQMWTRVGVRTKVEMLPSSMFASRAARQEFAVGAGSWGSNSGEAGYFLVNNLLSSDPAKGLGPFNWGRYSNPALDRLTEEAMATIDDAVRERLLQEAEAMAMADVAVVPLFQAVNVWATRKPVDYAPRADERTVAMSATLRP